MADDGLSIQIEAELAARLKSAADAAGQTAEAYASALIAQGLDDGWAEARASLAEYDRTGCFVDAQTALADARAALVDRLDRRR